MYTQRFKKITNVSIRSKLNTFLRQINYANISTPSRNDCALAAQSRNEFQRLTGKQLMRQSVKREAHRLQIYDRYLIKLATDHIWNLTSTISQRVRFTNQANYMNQNRVSRVRSNNPSTLDLIAKITLPQVSNNPFEQNFFNGTTNFDDNNPEHSILHVGSFGISTSFA
ncbi:9461_t:CDS:1 [Funneliformis mosseae]|uniref:9461_t:CDS:1 n=1 Tax=Funneliformis mosseae TaxID=27381 RepID=A0A9N9APN4_FUNMO|nr:9461_t:CDS:1 [Funneliformis mosseae]